MAIACKNLKCDILKFTNPNLETKSILKYMHYHIALLHNYIIHLSPTN